MTLHGPTCSFAGRVCAVRKSDCAIEEAHRRLRRKASKKQTRTRPETMEVAKYVVVFTTRNTLSAEQILESYRARWQIELVFKRLKTLIELGHLPKRDHSSSRAWLHGKLLIALLTQKLIHVGRNISPCGGFHEFRRPSSPWREFSFALHQVQGAIEPSLPLQETIFSWNQIARSLAEAPRNRLPQLSDVSAREFTPVRAMHQHIDRETDQR